MAKKKDSSGSNSMVVGLVATAGALAAASVARKALRITWKGVTGVAPPDDPKSREVDWTVAILWAVASGAAIGVARLVVERELVSRLGSSDD